jgi:hypothetical protein
MKVANGIEFSFGLKPALVHMPISAWQIFSSFT